MKNYIVKAIVFCSMVAIILWTLLVFVMVSFAFPHVFFGPQDQIHITVMDKSGDVKYSSWKTQDGRTLDNNALRNSPEISQALKGYLGHDTRYDGTLDDEIDFFAFRLNDEEVVQFALNHEDMSESIPISVAAIILVLILLLVICYFASALITGKIIKPLEKIDLDNLNEFSIRKNKVTNSPEIRKFINKISNYNSDRRQLIADLSHEYKTPLRVIGSHLYILQKKEYNNDSEMENHLQKIHEEITHMSKLLTTILETEKIYSESVITEYDRFSLNAVINEIVDIKTKEHKKISITVKFSDKCIEIEANEVLIFDVLRNLIDNAVLYAQTSIDISTREDNEYVYVTIGNDGDTIPPDKQKKIFERFYRVNHNSQNKTNYGMGLAIVKKILNSHKGDIVLKYSQDNYTEFEIKMPKSQHD